MGLTSDIPVMVFAAGRGTRMAPLTNKMPKPMLEVAGRPLIDYALELTQAAGLSNVFANTHHLPDMLEQHLHSRGVTTIHEPTLLETGGGLKNALPFLGAGPVLVLNSDAIWIGSNPIQGLLDRWRPNMGALLSLTHPDQAIGHKRAGDFQCESDGKLSRGPGLIYNGAHITRTERLAEISETVFSLNLYWDLLMMDSQLFGLEHTGRWCDVGRPESIALAEAALDV